LRFALSKPVILYLFAFHSPLVGQTPQAKIDEIPAENHSQGKIPEWSSAETLAKNLVQLYNQTAALKPSAEPQTGKSKRRELTPESLALFFPRGPFIQLKALPDPGTYHDQLLQEFAHHLQAQQSSLQSFLPITYASLEKGSCKWKKPQSEYNHIAYWSCYRSRLKFTDAKGGSHELPVKTLINWGTQWFITHLGLPPQKS
jgi:hypothetical protein